MSFFFFFLDRKKKYFLYWAWMGYVILRLSIFLNCLKKKKKKKDFIRNHGRLKQSLKRYSRYKISILQALYQKR